MALDVMFFENHLNKLTAYANSMGLRLRWMNEPMTLSLRVGIFERGFQEPLAEKTFEWGASSLDVERWVVKVCKDYASWN